MMLSTKNILIVITAISLLIMACQGENSQNSSANTSNSDEKPIVTAPQEGKPIEIIQEPLFNQAQLNPRILGLCVQFKNLEGKNRKQIFEMMEKIYPSCPITLLDDNTAEFGYDEAVQKMTVPDLIEMLGKPMEVREDKAMVYDLVGDESYRVVFFLDEKGYVACRGIEANG